MLLGEELDEARHPNEAKRELARRLADRFHGEGAGALAEERFDSIHKRGEIPDDIEEIEADAWTSHAGSSGDIHLPALIAAVFGMSNSEARRLITQGGVKVDGVAVPGDSLDVPADQLSGAVLQVGKRRFVRLRDLAR